MEIHEWCSLSQQQKMDKLEEHLAFQKGICSTNNPHQVMQYYHQYYYENDIEVIMGSEGAELPVWEWELSARRECRQIDCTLRQLLQQLRIQSTSTQELNNETDIYEDMENSSLIGNQLAEPQREVYTEYIPRKEQSQKGTHSGEGHSKEQFRKLELSRSIDNATNIINKLMQRSRLS